MADATATAVVDPGFDACVDSKYRERWDFCCVSCGDHAVGTLTVLLFCSTVVAVVVVVKGLDDATACDFS